MMSFRMFAAAALLAIPVIAAVTMFTIMPDTVWAQAAIPDDGGGGLIDDLLTTLEPRITELVALAMIALAGLITRWVARAFAGLPDLIRKYFGLQAERIWREALHQTLRSGVLATANDVFPSDGHRIDAVLQYAARSSPDTIADPRARSDVLRKLILAKMNEHKVTLASPVPR